VCLQQSVKLCKDGTDELVGLVSELAGKVDGKVSWKRNVGAARVLLKKEDV